MQEQQAKLEQEKEAILNNKSMIQTVSEFIFIASRMMVVVHRYPPMCLKIMHGRVTGVFLLLVKAGKFIYDLKGPKCLRNAVVFISLKSFIFVILLIKDTQLIRKFI
jgi:hypothetical protein